MTKRLSYYRPAKLTASPAVNNWRGRLIHPVVHSMARIKYELQKGACADAPCRAALAFSDP
jgi:hypothetical protein